MEFGSFATLSWGLRTSHTETKRLLFFSRTGSARKTPDFEKDTEKSSSAAGGSPQNNKKPAYPAAKLVGLILGPLLRSEEHTSELQSRGHLVCRLLLENKT